MKERRRFDVTTQSDPKKVELFDKVKRYIIFDLDGVILTLHPLLGEILWAAATQLSKSAGIFLAKENLDNYLDDIYHGRDIHHSSIRISVALRKIWPELKDASLYRAYRAILSEFDERLVYPLFEGAEETLALLRQRGFILVLCTNNSSEGVIAKFKKAGLALDTFSVICTASTNHMKPDPGILKPLYQNFPDIMRDEAVIVGDSCADFYLAKDLDIDFLAIVSNTPKGGMSKEAFIKLGVPQNMILGSINEIPDLLTY